MMRERVHYSLSLGSANSAPFSQRATPPVSLPLAVSDGLQSIYLLPKLHHQVEQLVQLLTPHASGILPILPRQQQAEALPAARDLNRHIIEQTLCLGCHSLCVGSTFPGEDHV